MNKFRLLLLTNLENGSAQEDLFLAQYLDDFFEVHVSHPKNCEPLEDQVDAILIRNIWYTKDYKRELLATWDRFKKKKLKTYNSLDGLGDRLEKTYLADASFQQRFPVIPTILSIKDLKQLPEAANYFVKPLDGGGSFGVQKLDREILIRMDPQHYLIQPFIDFVSELSFFFVDKNFAGALQTRNSRWDLVSYKPSSQEIMTAKQFAEWNTLSYGIQRVDFGRTQKGELLLMEIEDYCPYLSLLEMEEKMRNFLLQIMLESMYQNLFTR